jgi:hypothetical protein
MNINLQYLCFTIFSFSLKFLVCEDFHFRLFDMFLQQYQNRNFVEYLIGMISDIDIEQPTTNNKHC